MRPIQHYLLSRLKNKIQTTGNNNEIRSHVRLSRPKTVLENDLYLEKLPLGINNCDDCSIAVAHETPSRRNSRIDIMYIENGVAKWSISPTKYPMDEHVFVDTGFMESATSCSICYDSQTKLTRDGIVEMLTYGEPWLFWTDPLGGLWGQNGMDETTRISLATSNVSDVTAIRGLYNINPNYDYGLVLFFILGGTIYYRQYQNKTWTDAVAIGFGPSATYVEISATRSWDTRIFLQARTSTGAVYEMVSQQQGFAKNDLGENMGQSVSTIDARASFIDIVTLPPAKHQTENMGTGYSSIIPSVGYSDEPTTIRLVNVTNVAVGSNYGTRIDIEMTDYSSVDVSYWKDATKYYILTDSRGIVYSPHTILYDEVRSSRATLLFNSFNSAVGECTLSIVSGVLKTINGKIIPSLSYTFTPVGLVPPSKPGPKPTSITNSSDGKELYIDFDKSVYSPNIDYNLDRFDVYVTLPIYPDPNLEPIKQTRTPIDIRISGSKITLVFGNNSDENLRNFNDCFVTVAYIGGNLHGAPDEDIVTTFNSTFRAEGMYPANNQWTGVDITSTCTIDASVSFIDIQTLPPAKHQTENMGLGSSYIDITSITFTKIGDV